MKISELSGADLDYWVAQALKLSPIDWKPRGFFYWHDQEGFPRSGLFTPSTDWAQGGPIIDLCGINIVRCDDEYGRDAQGFANGQRIPVWCAAQGQQGTTTSTEHQSHEEMFQIGVSEVVYGQTALIAAMRCFVKSVYGDAVQTTEKGE